MRVRGLKGGHSGKEIDKGRLNANKVLGRLLYRLSETISFNIGSVSGGLKTNAIPREADLELLLKAEDVEKAKEILRAVEADFAAENGSAEPDFRLVIEPAAPRRMMTQGSTEQVTDLLTLLPNGAREYSQDIPGLVVASLNLGLVEETEEGVRFCYAIRANTDSFMPYIDSELKTLARLYGMTRVFLTLPGLDLCAGFQAAGCGAQGV